MLLWVSYLYSTSWILVIKLGTASPFIDIDACFCCKVLMIKHLTLWHDSGINIPNSSESRILASDIAKVFPLVTSRILGQTWKDQLNSGSLSIIEGTVIKKLGSEAVLSQILSGSYARTFDEYPRKFFPFHTGSWPEKMHILAGSWRWNLWRIRQGNLRHSWQNPRSPTCYDPDRYPGWIRIRSGSIPSEQDLELFQKNPGKDPDRSG